MMCLGIEGSGSDLIIHTARERLQGRGITIERLSDRKDYDAILILPDTDLSGHVLKCRILIIPEKTVLGTSEAKSVVSYGMSPKNTVTLSSTQGNQQVIALQRDVISLEETLVLRQEFTIDSELGPYETLALASLLVITGVLEL